MDPLDLERLVDLSARMMAIGMVIAEAPSGNIRFQNVEAQRLLGGLPPDAAVLERALAGERTIDAHVEVRRPDGARRTLSVNAAPVRGEDGAVIAAVATYQDVTEARRAHEAATYLARAGSVLERFDPATSLQAIAELAVPVLADWCYVHLTTAEHPVIVAIASEDRDALAAARARHASPLPVGPDTPLARVLAGGPAELVTIDDPVLIQATLDPGHLAEILARGYRSAVVAPLVGHEGVLGAIAFAMTESGRHHDAADLETLAELARRAGIALDNARLLAAEQRARRHAEEARDRTRRLQALTAALASAVEPAQVVSIMASAGRGALGAAAGFAWLLRDGGVLEMVGAEHGGQVGLIEQYRRVPLTARLPICDAIRLMQPLMFETSAALASAYPDAIPLVESPFQARAVLPFVVSGRSAGAVVFVFDDARAFRAEDRELLAAMAGQASIALERAQLYAALHEGEEQLRTALAAARAATWSLDLSTMTMRRDASYRALMGVDEEQAPGDFARIHPDDRAVARASFERALREDVAYEPEVRVQRGDGSYVWIRAHGRFIHGDDGRAHTLAGVAVDIDEVKRASLRAEEERRINETLHRLGTSFASELDHDRLVHLITDEITRLVGAERGVFLPAAAAAGADDAREPPLDRAAPSRLAAPVSGRSGEVFGHLVFDHPEPGRFTADHERLARSIASQAGVALENARLYRTVRDQKEQLEGAVERARLADQRKNEFLAMLGHELRNPLAPIATALELMDLRSSGALQKERAVIRRQVEHLARLLDDLLDVSRVTRGKVQLARRVIEIEAVIAQAMEMVRPLTERRTQRLAAHVPRAGLAVDADPTRLAQVFQNLLMNAAKYSEPGTEIGVRARGEGARVVVEVVDQGMGISAEIMPRLFDLFVQGARAIDRAEGGLGIGLTIAKSLCELHGGTIAAASAGPGQGSTFTVTLPRVVAAEGQAAAAAAGPPVEAGAEAEARVLVVDDNADAAGLLSELLESVGYATAVAYDGAAALEVARAFRPDAAVLDIGLPGMDGYELARALRALQDGERLRLIAVTGYGQEADRARARAAGFDHHLIKPVALGALLPLLKAPMAPPRPAPTPQLRS